MFKCCVCDTLKAVYLMTRRAGENSVSDERYVCSSVMCLAIGINRSSNKDQYTIMVTPV